MTRRHSGVILASSLLLAAGAALAGVPASAQSGGTPETYGASSEATALDLVLFGNGLTIGNSAASLLSDPKGTAKGVGALLPGLVPASETVAEVVADGQSAGSPTETCGPIALPEDFPAASLATACSSALASISSGLPTAAATGEVATLAVGVGETLGGTPLGDAVDDVNTTLGDLLGETPLPVDSLVDDLLSALNGTGDLVSVELGASAASSTALADTVASEGEAQGTVIELIQRETPAVDDVPAVALPPMVVIEVGAASATATVTRATGEAVGAFDPALVRVTIAEDVTNALGLPDGANVIELAPGQSQCLGLPAPLDSCITVGHGSVTPTDTGITSTASGVSLDLLTGLPEGGVGLDLAVATASVAGTPAQVPPTTTTAPDLPRTGGTTALPLLGFGLLALAALSLGALRLTDGRRH